MEYVSLVGAFILVLLTGLVKVRNAITSLVKDYDLVYEFRDKFIQLLNVYKDHLFDEQLYHYLVSYMDKVQVLLGTYGIAHYTAKFNRFQAPNYLYLLNTIPQIRTGQADPNDLLTCEDMLVRYLGGLERKIDDERSKYKNPVIWLQLGLQYYIGLPVRILYWFGIISNSSFSRITSSQFFKVISGIGGLIAFLASLIQLLQAWPFVTSLF